MDQTFSLAWIEKPSYLNPHFKNDGEPGGWNLIAVALKKLIAFLEILLLSCLLFYI